MLLIFSSEEVLMRQILTVILPLATYFVFGSLFEFAEFVSEVAGQGSDKFASWKGLRFVLPAIPAVAVLRGMLAIKNLRI